MIGRSRITLIRPHKRNVARLASFVARALYRCVVFRVALNRKRYQHLVLPLRLRNMRGFKSLRHFFDLRPRFIGYPQG